MLIMDMYKQLQAQCLEHLPQTEQPPDRKRVVYCEGLVSQLEEVLPPDHHHLGWMKERMGYIRAESIQAADNPEQLQTALEELEGGAKVTERIYGSSHRKVAISLLLKAAVLEEARRSPSCRQQFGTCKKKYWKETASIWL